jgi:hypothetical protein
MSKSSLLIALIASAAFASLAHAEPVKPATPETHKAGCKAIYEVYDINMETHYDKSLSSNQRQAAYVNAQRALSDFRKAGCKYKDIA